MYYHKSTKTLERFNKCLTSSAMVNELFREATKHDCLQCDTYVDNAHTPHEHPKNLPTF
jgi:hypothetical protein